MKSNKQRKAELKAKKQAKAARDQRAEVEKRRQLEEQQPKKVKSRVAVNPANIAPHNSTIGPDFLFTGYYEDKEFLCAGCGSEQIWSATQQKWWYEVAKGSIYSTAKLCRSCRRKKREGRLVQE